MEDSQKELLVSLFGQAISSIVSDYAEGLRKWLKDVAPEQRATLLRGEAQRLASSPALHRYMALRGDTPEIEIDLATALKAWQGDGGALSDFFNSHPLLKEMTAGAAVESMMRIVSEMIAEAEGVN